MDKVRNLACSFLARLRSMCCAASERLSQSAPGQQLVHGCGWQTMSRMCSSFTRKLLMTHFIPSVSHLQFLLCHFLLLPQVEDLHFYLLFPFKEKEEEKNCFSTFNWPPEHASCVDRVVIKVNDSSSCLSCEWYRAFQK